jgi:flavin reductase (DIM6/NTAB) family NADH-FMN oxidoreductase RutF
MSELQKAHRLLSPRVAYLVGSRAADGTANIIPVSNLTSISTAPQQIAVAIFKQWQTHHNLLAAQGFTVSVPTIHQLAGVWKLGAKYSRYTYTSAEAKLVDSGLAIDSATSEYGPILADGVGWLAVQKLQHLDFGGDHTLFVAQVAKLWFNPAFLNPDGTPHQEVRPVMQVTGNLFTTAARTWEISYFAND